MKRTIFAFCFVLAAVSQGFSLDNLIVKGRIIDNTATAAPLVGLKVAANFLMKDKKTTTTDASGNFEIGFPGAEVFGSLLFVTISETGFAQYLSKSIGLPSGTNQNDGKNDTLIVADIKVPPLAGSADLLTIKGSVALAVTNAPLPSVTVNVYSTKSGRFVEDLITTTTTGTDGSFSVSIKNEFSLKYVTLIVVDPATQTKLGEIKDTLPANTSVTDGKTDTISQIITVKLITGTLPSRHAYSAIASNGPVSVSIYSLSGRLLLNTTVADVNRFAASEIKNAIHTTRPVIMVWKQNNVMHTKQIVRLP